MQDSAEREITPGGVIELRSRNEYGHDFQPSPRNYENSQPAMKAVPMNFNGRKSPEAKSPEGQGTLFNQNNFVN